MDLRRAAVFALALGAGCAACKRHEPRREEFSLFNGHDLSGWVVPKGDHGHWKVVDGVIDCDAKSEAPGEKHLWTKDDFYDFVLHVEWRITGTAPFAMPDVLPDGIDRLGPDGQEIRTVRPNADSGVYLRGSLKAQVNIWCWPIGSGEVLGYRTDEEMSKAVRAAATPKLRADKPVGEWNAFDITMKGDRLTVVLNDQTVIENAALPGVPSSGPIGFQHHGTWEKGVWVDPPSFVQYRNIKIREL